MKCSLCQTEMAQSTVGWLCPNCGYIETNKSKTAENATQIQSDPSTQNSIAASSPASPNPTPEGVTSATSTDAADVTQPKAQAEAAESSSPLPSSTTHHLMHLLRTVIVIVALFIILAISSIAYALAARKPYLNFQTKLKSAQTFGFDGQLQFLAEGFLSSFNSDLQYGGHYDSSNPKSPQGDLNFKGIWASAQYSGQSVLRDGTAFFKLDGDLLPVIRYNQSSFLYPLTSTWYRTKIDNSLYGNYCETRPDSHYPQGLELYRLITGLKTNNSPFVNLFGKLNGQSATEYHGTVESSQLPALFTQVNAQLPEGCGLQYYTPPTDPKKLTISYTLLTSPSADRITFTLNDKSVGAKIYFMINLREYNKPVKITPPADSIDLAAVRQEQLNILSRDHQRKNDLDKLKSSLFDYAAANKQLFPPNLNSLVPRHTQTISLDPKTKQSYSYATGPGRKNYTLSAILEEPNAGTYTVSGP